MFAGTAVTPVYANPASAMSQGLAYEDAEVSALLDQMAAEFEAQYQNNPVALDQALAGLDRSFNAIKKMANKLLPGGLPGQIVWIAGKFGVKEFI